MKLTNDYARLIPGYELFPKTVLAAIAFSLAMRLEDESVGMALRLLITEWDTLNQNGIVPQRLPAGLRSVIDDVECDYSPHNDPDVMLRSTWNAS